MFTELRTLSSWPTIKLASSKALTIGLAGQWPVSRKKSLQLFYGGGGGWCSENLIQFPRALKFCPMIIDHINAKIFDKRRTVLLIESDPDFNPRLLRLKMKKIQLEKNLICSNKYVILLFLDLHERLPSPRRRPRGIQKKTFCYLNIECTKFLLLELDRPIGIRIYVVRSNGHPKPYWIRIHNPKVTSMVTVKWLG